MTEKILTKNKNGMAMLLILLAVMLMGIIGFIWCIDRFHVVLAILLGLAVVAACIMLAGLKVLRPQEALVLTLFGQYAGTLKGEGFYWVNPFCAAVNPAAGTQLNQSGDVKSTRAAEPGGMKMSLKIMTLSNNKQKINDCLGNPVEIGIAVMWRVVDTAKAAFNVDNYKAFLSLQCDSALRNIVRLYPYDSAPNVDTTGDGQADDAALWDACRTACADEFLEKMPKGLDSDLGQGGVNVSGGQKQRLCIARALLKKPKILIFDDSTSAVDMATEAKIRTALNRRSDVTKLIIAQRITSVMGADQIIVLDDGKVHAVGTHKELLATDSIYQEIYHSQMKGDEAHG